MQMVEIFTNLAEKWPSSWKVTKEMTAREYCPEGINLLRIYRKKLRDN